MSFRRSQATEKSDSPRRVILRKAKDLLLNDRSLSLFGTMLRIGFLPSVEMTVRALLKLRPWCPWWSALSKPFEDGFDQPARFTLNQPRPSVNMAGRILDRPSLNAERVIRIQHFDALR